MIIDEVIKRLETYLGYAENDETARDEEALKLGIEALKQVKRYREILRGFYQDKLPGETEE